MGCWRLYAIIHVVVNTIRYGTGLVQVVAFYINVESNLRVDCCDFMLMKYWWMINFRCTEILPTSIHYLHSAIILLNQTKFTAEIDTS